MSTKSLSIGQRLKKYPSDRQEIALDWARHWKDDQELIVRKLKSAALRQDWNGIGKYLAQLDAVTTKMLEALPRVITALSNLQEDSP